MVPFQETTLLDLHVEETHSSVRSVHQTRMSLLDDELMESDRELGCKSTFQTDHIYYQNPGASNQK